MSPSAVLGASAASSSICPQKPANVLIQGADSPRPVAKLTDFGLSRLRMATVATCHPDAGTPAYLAPECFSTENNVVTHHMDMYAMGVLLWSMLTGLRPWRAQCQSIVIIAYRVTMLGERPPLDQLSERRCPQKLKRLIQECWEHDPRKRPAAAQMVKELSELLRQCDDTAGASTETALVDADTGNMLGPATGAAPHLTPTAAASLRALRAFSSQRDAARSQQRALVVAAAEAAAAMASGVRSEGSAPPAAPPQAHAGALHGRGSSKDPLPEAAAAAADLHRMHSMPQQQPSQQQQQQQQWPLLFLKSAKPNESCGDADGPRKSAKGAAPGEGAPSTLASGSGTASASASRSEGRTQQQQASGSAMAASSSSSISEPHMTLNVPPNVAQQLMQVHAESAAAAAGGGGPPPLPLPYLHQQQQQQQQQLGAAGQTGESSHMFSTLIPHQHHNTPPAQRSGAGGGQHFLSSEAISNTALLRQLAGIELDLDLVAASTSASTSSAAYKDAAAVARAAAAAAARAVRAGLGTPVATDSVALSGEGAGSSSRSAAGGSGEGGDGGGGCVTAAAGERRAAPKAGMADVCKAAAACALKSSDELVHYCLATLGHSVPSSSAAATTAATKAAAVRKPTAAGSSCCPGAREAHQLAQLLLHRASPRLAELTATLRRDVVAAASAAAAATTAAPATATAAVTMPRLQQLRSVESPSTPAGAAIAESAEALYVRNTHVVLQYIVASSQQQEKKPLLATAATAAATTSVTLQLTCGAGTSRNAAVTAGSDDVTAAALLLPLCEPQLLRRLSSVLASAAPEAPLAVMDDGGLVAPACLPQADARAFASFTRRLVWLADSAARQGVMVVVGVARAEDGAALRPAVEFLNRQLLQRQKRCWQ
ncbi:hypothetical protein HYH02_003703 [Chlamydomonas schloesseri]|uniref:Protein kinase domain-containing protein n=1 Tax=Chlamydomonas schloesseri TaxID=2026947 RepID=A0A836B9W4_9CHLO|nr:hypothetical protein HYH02_003703 [Chlamydomonas schloesseri]|eukprot:KAG2451928.1 hypothetical protein HYH02_003703 [Chlamydomonas schloesseri]